MAIFILVSSSFDKNLTPSHVELFDSSLQIFEDEAHPSMHSSICGRKEGLSLFGRCLSL